MFRSLLVVTLITAAHRMGEQMRGQAGLKKGEGVKVSGRLKSTGRKLGTHFFSLFQSVTLVKLAYCNIPLA